MTYRKTDLNRTCTILSQLLKFTLSTVSFSFLLLALLSQSSTRSPYKDLYFLKIDVSNANYSKIFQLDNNDTAVLAQVFEDQPKVYTFGMNGICSGSFDDITDTKLHIDQCYSVKSKDGFKYKKMFDFYTGESKQSVIYGLPWKFNRNLDTYNKEYTRSFYCLYVVAVLLGILLLSNIRCVIPRYYVPECIDFICGLITLNSVVLLAIGLRLAAGPNKGIISTLGDSSESGVGIKCSYGNFLLYALLISCLCIQFFIYLWMLFEVKVIEYVADVLPYIHRPYRSYDYERQFSISHTDTTISTFPSVSLGAIPKLDNSFLSIDNTQLETKEKSRASCTPGSREAQYSLRAPKAARTKN